MDDATLCHVLDGDEALLIYKKRGVGSDQWNAPGGKVEPGETPRACAIREVREEVGIRVREPEKVGVFDYYSEDWDARIHVYLAREFGGEPEESEEARPRWFPVDDLPYDEMWQTDRAWVPHLLAGERFRGEFVYEGGEPVEVTVETGVDPDEVTPVAAER